MNEWGLSNREMAVLILIASGGYSMRQVAGILGISHHTIKIHLGNAYATLGVHSATQAFIALGWLRVPAGVIEGNAK